MMQKLLGRKTYQYLFIPETGDIHIDRLRNIYLLLLKKMNVCMKQNMMPWMNCREDGYVFIHLYWDCRQEPRSLWNLLKETE